jgi:hypothetical protein
MNATQTRTRLSGCARRRARAIARREYVTELAYRREEAAFYEHGTIPPSSTGVSICSCGGRAFTRADDGDLNDFAEAHAYCDDEAAS